MPGAYAALSNMWPEVIYFALGTLFGLALSLTRKEERTFEQVDEVLRREHTYFKHLAESLQEDATYLRRKVAALQVTVNEKQK